MDKYVLEPDEPPTMAAAWLEVCRQARLERRRVSFLCHPAVLALIEREMRESGRSKTEVIVDALLHDLPEEF